MTVSVTTNAATTAEEAAKIRPRAEFRVFGHGIIEAVNTRMWNGKTLLQHARSLPAETYFVSRNTQGVNVKVRDGLLDIKVKTGETDEGYEIFQPRGKFKFPVSKKDLAAIMAQLKADLPAELAGRETCTFEAFLGAIRKHPDLVPVTVEKMRWGFTIDGVICEYAKVYLNGALLESACVEGEDHAAMRAVIEGLGLSGRPNVNYPKVLADVVGVS
ncbi:MAG TPA: hypothetical protein PKU70_10825 [Vicinamibacteria bacterium]|nr:hypothetical protein [Vicinamibacteria bacterium]HRB13496.1 hypothetical protein [Vicinamibacteria bacterium]